MPDATSQAESLFHPSRLCLDFEQAHGQTGLQVREQQAPWKVVRAFPLMTGEALVHLHNLSGGVLGGDQLHLDVKVGPGACVQLTSTGATRVYRSRPGIAAARVCNEIRVEQGSLLEFLPDPLIPFSGSRYEQSTRIQLQAGATLFWWETIAPGREASGELFGYDLLYIRVAIEAEGRPIAAERIRLQPKLQPLNSLARLGTYRYFSTFYICRSDRSLSWLVLEGQLSDIAMQMTRPGEVLWGVSTLPAHGLVVRGLSLRGRDLPPGLLAFWQTAKKALCGRDAVLPRKLY